jgi:hypothetical protein
MLMGRGEDGLLVRSFPADGEETLLVEPGLSFLRLAFLPKEAKKPGAFKA